MLKNQFSVALALALLVVACRFQSAKLAPCSVSADCASGFRCEDASVCLDRLGNGSTCGAASDCVSGNCVDGVCCETSCTARCVSCALSSAKGQCKPISAGQTPAGECAGAAGCAGSCDGDGGCTYPTGSVCASSCDAGVGTTVRCDGGSCALATAVACGVYACNAGSTACNVACAGHSECSDDAGYCLDAGCVPQKDAGAACNGNVECRSKSCAVSVCQ